MATASRKGGLYVNQGGHGYHDADGNPVVLEDEAPEAPEPEKQPEAPEAEAEQEAPEPEPEPEPEQEAPKGRKSSRK